MKKSELKKIVEEVLRKHPETRDDDMLLTIYVWWEVERGKFFKVGNKKAILVEDMLKMIREDHVARIRRKINEEGYYWPLREATVRQRRMNMDRWKSFIKQGVDL